MVQGLYEHPVNSNIMLGDAFANTEEHTWIWSESQGGGGGGAYLVKQEKKSSMPAVLSHQVLKSFKPA
jgi:hypothetical protein